MCKAWTKENERERLEGMMKETNRKKELDIKEEGMGREREEDEGQRGWRVQEEDKGWTVEKGKVFIARKAIPGSMKRFSSLKSQGFHMHLLNLSFTCFVPLCF